MKRMSLPLKRILVIVLSVLLCFAMWNVMVLISDTQQKASADTEISTDVQNSFTTTDNDNEGSEVTFDSSNKMTFAKTSSVGRTSFVSTSKSTIDFSQGFTLSGTLVNTRASDGFTITFQPKSDFGYNSTSFSGSNLCVYNGGATNALVAEFDTYDGNGNGTDARTVNGSESPLVKALKANDNWDGKSSIVPHMAIATLDSTGTETVQNATFITVGDKDETPVNRITTGTGTYDVTISWTITDESKGTGTYSVTYKDEASGGCNKTITYENLDPASLFGSTNAYLSFTGAIDFNSGNAGISCSVPWSFQFNSASYTKYDPELTVSETSSLGDSAAQSNDKVKFTITLKNIGKGDAVGVRVRRYMPDYTTFYSVDDSGNYGCINQKEHATWFIKKIPAGEAVTLTFTTMVDVCHPDNYKLADEVLYEVTGSTTAPYVNTKVDPSQSIN